MFFAAVNSIPDKKYQLLLAMQEGTFKDHKKCQRLKKFLNKFKAAKFFVIII